MIRNRRRFADTMLMARYSTPYLAMAMVSILAISSWISNIHAAAPTPGESYLYNTQDSIPVLDHGLLSASDFTKSTSPKVVEFYDPKCGACQAFKSNYIEVAKKVQAQKPNVEFYGVSCEAYQSLCDKYGGPSVPKIFAFPSAESAGIEVPKGAGTIYFLSARLMKALRSPEEIASDGEKLGGVEAPMRRLGEDSDDDEGDDEDVSGEGDDDSQSEEEEVFSGDGDHDAESDDVTEEVSGSEDAVSEDDEDTVDAEDSNQSEGSQDRQEASSDEPVSRGRYEDVALLDKYMAEDRSGDKQVSRDNDERSDDKDTNLSEGSQDRRDASPEQGQPAKPQNSEKKQALTDQLEKLDRYKHTDAYKNTMREFEKKDIEKGKEKGYHWRKWEEARQEASMPDARDRNNIIESMQNQSAAREVPPSSRQSIEGGIRQREATSQDREEEARLRAAREIAASKREARQEASMPDARNGNNSESVQNQSAARNVPPSSRQSIEGDKRQREATSEDREKETRLHGARDRNNSESAQNQSAARPVPISRQSTVEGGGRQREATSEDREREARLRGAREIAARKNPSSRQSIGGDIRQRETPVSGQPGQPRSGPMPRTGIKKFQQRGEKNIPLPPHDHSGPIPIVNINKSEERGETHIPLPPRDHMPVGGDVYVPNPFNTDPVKAKKFQEYVARRAKMLEQQEKLKHPIKTILGNGATKELENGSGAIHMKKSPTNNYKTQYNPNTGQLRKVPDLRPEAQHKTLGEKVLKKIPIVKRAFKRSKGEETLNDAALSFTRSLLMGAFKTNAALDYKRKAALVDWLDLLRVSLPPEIGLHELIDTLKYNIDSISQRQENLLTVINKHPLPDHKWSDSCTKGMKSGGFFCGFWKLLHVMSVGFAEQAGGLSLLESSPSMRVFSAKEAGDVVREYMALFFNCEKCSKRFVAQYDDCSFQRCHRLSGETVDASAESWQEFPLWLWQVHNDISRSKSIRASDFHEKGGRKAEAKKWERDMKAVYPHIDQCINCVTLEGTWKLNAVYNHLEKEYWTFGIEIDPKMEKFLEYNDIERRTVSHGFGAYVLITLIALLALFAKKRRIRATGRHKKIETSPSEIFPKKYRDS